MDKHSKLYIKIQRTTNSQSDSKTNTAIADLKLHYSAIVTNDSMARPTHRSAD